MQCSDVRKLLPGLALGDLDAEPAREAGNHLEACAGCRAERQALESTVGLLRRAAPAPPSTERRAAAVAAMARAHGEMAERLLVRPARSWTVAAAAAGFFLALLAGAALLLPFPRADFSVASVSGRAVFRSATGEWKPLTSQDVLGAGDRVVTLPGTVVSLSAGGSTVFLDQNTSMSVVRGRTVTLDRGRLFAELPEGAAPFTVTDTGNNAAILRSGRAEMETREVRGLVAGGRQGRDGESHLPGPVTDVASRLLVRVADGEADLSGSYEQRLRATRGTEGGFDIGGRPSTSAAGAAEIAPWRAPGFYSGQR